MFDISIVIVSWNAKKYLCKCLQSIYKTIHNLKFEVIVVDNDSNDGSPEMVKRKFPQVNLICTGSNFGFAKANNIGIKKSKGRYIALVNSDVEIINNCIEIMYSYIDKHPLIGILGPKVLNPDKTLQRSVKKFPTLWNILCRALSLDKLFPRSKLFGGSLMTSFSGDRISNVDVLIGAFWMARKEAINEVGLLDENFFIYSEDIDWCKRFNQKGWKVVFYPDAEIIHYGGKSSSNEPINFYAKLQQAKLQYWKKHHSKLSYLLTLFIMLLHQIIRLIVWIFIYLFLQSKHNISVNNIKRYIAGIKSLLCNIIVK